MSYKTKHKLSNSKQTEMFIKFARAVSKLNSPEEVARFLKDLLSNVEALMLARRLQIAELLIAGETYKDIREELKVGFSTIARVQTWLELYGEGYRTAVQRIEQKPKPDRPQSLVQLKRRYPMYFWPQLLLEEIVRLANKREKERLLKVVEQLKEKSQLSVELRKLLS